MIELDVMVVGGGVYTDHDVEVSVTTGGGVEGGGVEIGVVVVITGGGV